MLEIFAENLSKWPMVVTYSVSNGGLIYSPLPLVQPGKKEAFVTHKVGDTATGTYGKYITIFTPAVTRR